MAKKKQITIQDRIISWQTIDNEDYISLTDMVKDSQRPADVIRNWLRTKDTLNFLGTWEKLFNPDFKVFKFEHFYNQAGLATFVMTAKEWVEQTNAIGIRAKRGRGGGTWAHRDIAFEFGSRISPSFKLLLIREFQRLKEAEIRGELGTQEWNANRFLTKRNYSLQTEAVKHNLIPQSTHPPDKEWINYAEEADLLNVALFGITAKQWREANPRKAEGGHNIRDYANNIQLLVLSNLEAINSELIRSAMPKEERFLALQEAVIFQLQIFYRENKPLK